MDYLTRENSLKMKFDLINMPLNLGANKKGVEQGGKTIAAKIKRSNCFAVHELRYIDTIQCLSFVDVHSSDPLFKNKEQILAVDTQFRCGM